jgi:predicted aspartyl protease
MARRASGALLLIAFLLVPGCGLFLRVAPRSTEMPPGGAVLPTRQCGNAFLVEATINGRGPYVLLIDTGAGLTAVTPEVAAALESARGRTLARVIGATGKTATVHGKLRIDVLEAGGLRLRSFDALVMHMDGFEVIMGGRLDGVLGYPAFRDTTLVMDYPRSEVRVSRETGEPAGRSIRHSVAITGRDVPVVTFTLGDRVIEAIIDSGSGGEIALGPHSADVTFATRPVPAGSTLALGGSQVRLLGRAAEDARLANVVLRRPLIETDAALNLIGTEVLKHFVVTLDPRAQMAEFRPVSDGPIEFEPLYGIGIGAAPQEGAIRVAQVFPGSAAERCGVRAGDELRALDGRPVAELICERARLFPRPGPVRLTVQREGKTLELMCQAELMVP